jgi:hypothetical protein
MARTKGYGKKARAKGTKPRGEAVDESLKALAKMTNGGRGKHKRTDGERERDLAELAELHLKRYYQWEVIAIMNEKKATRGYLYTQQMIIIDLEEIYSRWRSSTLLDFNEAKWREIDTINLVEREAYRAWTRSIGNQTTITRDLSGDDLTEEKAAELFSGKPEKKVTSEYLRVILACSDRRVALMGLATGSAPSTRAARVGGEELPGGDYDIGIELDVKERARRLISIITIAEHRMRTGEKPVIEINAEPETNGNAQPATIAKGKK